MSASVCPLCEGTGKVGRPSFVNGTKTLKETCLVCKGAGKLVDEIAEAEARGYIRCTADVVALLLEKASRAKSYDEAAPIDYLKLQIWRGDHIGAAERAKGGQP